MKQWSLWAGLFVLFAVVGAMAPLGLALSYQVRGGVLLEQASRDILEQGMWEKCQPTAAISSDARQWVMDAIEYLNAALKLNPILTHANLLLGRAYCLLGDTQNAIQSYLAYVSLRPQNPLGHLELALAYQALSGYFPDDRAAAELQQANITVSELLGAGDEARLQDNTADAVLWYLLAVELDQTNATGWLRLGRICQRADLKYADICGLFLDWNSGNRFVDLGFTHTPLFEMWQPNEYTDQTSYRVEDCPGWSDKRCVHIAILPGDDSQVSAGVYQCIRLAPGTMYRYAAWIKTEVDEGVSWRPLYVGGTIASKPVGIWDHSESDYGLGEWFYWEYEFEAPAFDRLACFYPVMLEGKGDAWLHSAQLFTLIGPP